MNHGRTVAADERTDGRTVCLWTRTRSEWPTLDGPETGARPPTPTLTPAADSANSICIRRDGIYITIYILTYSHGRRTTTARLIYSLTDDDKVMLAHQCLLLTYQGSTSFVCTVAVIPGACDVRANCSHRLW